MKRIIQLLKEEDGQSMVEYGIILALISVVAIGVVQTVGQKLVKGDGSGAFEKVNQGLHNAGFTDGGMQSAGQ